MFLTPRHPYTAALLRSAPVEDGPAPEGIAGVVPPPTALPTGCIFGPRCDRFKPECAVAHPALEAAGEGRAVRCIRWNAA